MSNSTIHSSQEVLYIGPLTPHQDHTVQNTFIIERVQSHSFSIVPGLESFVSTNHKPHNYYYRPQLNVDISYLTTNGFNERNLGLYTNGLDNTSGIHSGFFCRLDRSEPNIFVAQSTEIREGLRDISNNKKVIGYGNCSLLSYNFSAGVGQLAISSVSLNPLNIAVFSGASGNWLPSVKTAQENHGQRDTEYFFSLPSGNNYSLGQKFLDTNDANTINFIGPQDIVVMFPTGAGFLSKQSEGNGLNVQSLQLNCETLRDDIFRMGNFYPSHRNVKYPIKVSLNLDILVSDREIYDIFNLRCDDNTRNISIFLKKHCSETIAMEFHLRGARLSDYSENSVVNGRKQASLTYTISIFNVNDFENNLFIRSCQGDELLTPTSTSFISGYDVNGVPYMETVTSYAKSYIQNQ